MSVTNFKTENNTYRKLLGTGLSYQIPRFQRDYSWSAEEWEDLWADIIEVTSEKGDPSHYMGYLVLQTRDDKTFDVIDGQQRLTTLTVLVLAVMRVLQSYIHQGIEKDRNTRRLEQIRQNFIGYLDPVSLVAKSKLTLNRHNNNYFQSYLVPLRDLPQRGFRASEHMLRKASDWFETRIRDFVRERPTEDPGVVLAQLVEDVSDKLFFTVITVGDELNAYKVFETLNARGVRLSATDLLKNFLFSILHRDGNNDAEMDAMESQWENMVGRLGEENFPDYLRVHWIAHHALVRQTDLFKTIRAKIPDRAAVFDLLRSLDGDLDSYMSLISPDTSGWTGTTKNATQLLRMFSVRQPFSLLIAARPKLSDQDFEKLVKAVVVISFRYNVIGRQQASVQERVYSSVAQRISKGELSGFDAIIEALRPVYVTDQAFRSAFSEAEIRTKQSRNKRIVRYIMCRLEKELNGSEFDLDADDFNIEHILPENPGDNWSFSDIEADACLYRLGNMTLLNAKANREIGHESFEIKRPVFAKSEFEITRKVAEFEQWDIDSVGQRQSQMAKRATTVWRIAKLA